VAPVEVSNVETLICRLQGTTALVEKFRVTLARMVPRTPVSVELEKGKDADAVWPPPTVNVVALPIAVPAEFKKEMEPVHDAAVPVASLTTVTFAVSVLPRPNSGSVVVRVTVFVVWPHAADAPIAIAARARMVLL
jgi:hypothetical protein